MLQRGWGGENQELRNDYGSVGTGDKAGRRIQRDDRNLAMLPRAVDGTVSKRREEELTIDSSPAILTQKIQEAQGIAAKWKAHIEQKGDLNWDEKEISLILQEATNDIKYWDAHKNKILSWFPTDGSEEIKEVDVKKRQSFLRLSTAASEAIAEAQAVVEFYLNSLDALKTQQSLSALSSRLSGGSRRVYTGNVVRITRQLENSKPLQGASSETMNPLNNPSNYSVSQQGEIDGFTLASIKRPSPEEPLTSKSLTDVLETWVGNAEIRYDKSTGEYKSYCSQPTSFLETVRRMAGRSQQERDQHRDAIEKIAQGLGIDRAEVFKNDWSVRVKNTLGEPLTPKLIKSIQRGIEQGLAVQRERKNIVLEHRRETARFVERVGELWQRLWTRNSHPQYSTISDN